MLLYDGLVEDKGSISGLVVNNVEVDIPEGDGVIAGLLAVGLGVIMTGVGGGVDSHKPHDLGQKKFM